VKTYDWPPPTVFIDLDGTLIKHAPPAQLRDPFEPLPRAVAFLADCAEKGIRVIICTARPFANHHFVKTELFRLKMIHTQLVMDCGNGVRYLVNDRKPLQPFSATAVAANVTRNEGLFSLMEIK
jgi:hydroxymethylpyrimidine pyrophosphatase-like HAD family hydrolase